MKDMCLRYSLEMSGILHLGYSFGALSNMDIEDAEHPVVELLNQTALEWRARRQNPVRKYMGWIIDTWADAGAKLQVRLICQRIHRYALMHDSHQRTRSYTD